eukprot:gene7036-7783_t
MTGVARQAFKLLCSFLWDREDIALKVGRPSIVTNVDKLGECTIFWKQTSSAICAKNLFFCLCVNIDNLIGRHPNLTDPHIYVVTTESLEGMKELHEQLKNHRKTWKLYHYAPSIFNSNEVISPMEMAQRTQGSIGKHSLIALLLAMEARYYILTTGSNWSRLIDELRKNVVDVQCGNCTEMVDLRRAYSRNFDNWRL